MELAEADVTVGDQGTHPEFGGERERVTVGAVGVLREIAARGDLAEEAQDPGFVARSFCRCARSRARRATARASSGRPDRRCASPR